MAVELFGGIAGNERKDYCFEKFCLIALCSSNTQRAHGCVLDKDKVGQGQGSNGALFEDYIMLQIKPLCVSVNT